MVKEGSKLAAEGKIVTFGVVPTRVETGYGYIEIGEDKEVKSFCEKPIERDAMNMVKSKAFLWNSGIFLAKAAEILKAAEKFQPEMTKSVVAAIDCIKKRPEI